MSEAGRDATIELVTKPVLRWMAVVPPPVLIVVFAVSRAWVFLASAMWATVVMGELNRRYIAVRDGVLYRRRLIGWADPLDLTQLRAIDLRRSWGARDSFPERRLEMADAAGERLSLALVMWDNWPSLVREIVGRLLIQPQGTHLRLPADLGTVRFLAAFVPMDTRPRFGTSGYESPDGIG